MKSVRIETGICHFRVPQAQSISEFLAQQELPELGIPSAPDMIQDWLHFGCIYVNGIRCRTDQVLKPDSIVRLHTRNKRFNCQTLANQIVFQDDDLVVLNKPSGMPTHPTLDNYVENAKFILENELQRSIYVTHRLDIETRGLLIFAKTKTAQSEINRRFANRQVTKIYHADAERELAPGRYVHSLDPNGRVPRPIVRGVHESWWECRLVIENCRPLGFGFRHRVRLETGRTHQIRAQFASEGAPLLGDRLYGGPPSVDTFGLACIELGLRLKGQDRQWILV